MGMLFWKAIADGRGPISGPAIDATRFWVYIAASSKEIARAAAPAYLAIVAPSLGETAPEQIGRVVPLTETLYSVRREGEVVRLEAYFAPH